MNKQQLIAKYGKKFAIKADKKNPMCEGIHYGKDGVVFVTNRHYAVRIRSAHTFAEPVTIHATSGAPISGEYPDVSKIFPSSFDNEIILDRKQLEQALKYTRCAAEVATRLNKAYPVAALNINSNGESHLQVRNATKELELSAFFGNAQKLDASKRSLNVEYLHTALSVFNDSELYPDVVVKFKGHLDPIVLTDEKDIDVLILPYRVVPE